MVKRLRQSGKVSDDWKKANITLILRNSKKEDLGNYSAWRYFKLKWTKT